MNNFNTPPAYDEIEISIFSKGVGECCVIHLGNGSWIVIDSFLNKNKIPISLCYLDDIGVNIENIILLVTTHWHDDHIKGMSKLVEQCKTAKFAYSTVLCNDEFRGAISKFSIAENTKFSSGVREFVEITKILKSAPERKRLAAAQRRLFSSDSISIEALSPSDEDINLFLQEIEGWSAITDVDRIVPIPRRNDTSVAIAISVDGDHFLFGADLEVRGRLSGWHAVHEQYWNDRGKCSFFKIAHHGSVTGYHEPVWDEMLVENAFAALTPYGRGASKVPSNADVTRIIAKTTNGYAAGDGHLSKPKGLHHSVERTLAEAKIRVRQISDNTGQVRFRKKRDGKSWNVELFGTAHPLSENCYPEAKAATQA